MKQKQHTIKQDILFVLISSFIVVVAWIGFNIYHIWVTSTIDEEVQMQLTPIDPRFDTTVIENVKSRNQIEPAFSKQDNASPAAVLSPTPPPVSTPTQPATEDIPVTIQGL